MIITIAAAKQIGFLSACKSNASERLPQENSKITPTLGIYDPSERERGFYNIYDYLNPTSGYSTKATTAVNPDKMPDMMLVTGLPCERFAEKGYFVDLYRFIGSDTGTVKTNKDDLFPGPLNAMEYNGGLYWISPEFSVVTFYGRSSIFALEQFCSYDVGCLPDLRTHAANPAGIN